MSDPTPSIAVMSAPDIDSEVMGHFAALAGNAHLTILLGAGASAPCGLPTWDEFASRLAVLGGLVDGEDAARTLLSKQDPTIVLSAAREYSGENWSEHLNEALYGGLSTEAMPSALHLAAAGHYMASPDKTTLSTLNFDTLLESAVLAEGSPLVTIDIDGEDEAEDVPTVHHLHGAIFDGSAFSPVVDYHDFAELIAEKGAWQYEFLKNALRRGPLLLAGTSYRDPDIRHWLHLVLRREKPDYPAIVTIVREGLELDAESFQAIDKALAAEWKAIGLRALRMQDLTDAAIILRELQFAAAPNYRTPNARVLDLWEAHAKHFEQLQREYGESLAADAKQIEIALGADAHRGTLWLANGRGALARWATEGNHYHGLEHLKLVPTGHDSPWIAGEAIGTEEVKLKDVQRDHRVSPTWQSVLAIPIFVGDGYLPDVASAVLTVGLSENSEELVSRQEEWGDVTQELSNAWGTRLAKWSSFTQGTGIG